MKIKYKLTGTEEYSGEYDLTLNQMLTGRNPNTKEFWISFPIGFEFRTLSQSKFLSVKIALEAVLSGDEDDALIDSIGTIESNPTQDRGYTQSFFMTRNIPKKLFETECDYVSALPSLATKKDLND